MNQNRSYRGGLLPAILAGPIPIAAAIVYIVIVGLIIRAETIAIKPVWGKWLAGIGTGLVSVFPPVFVWSIGLITAFMMWTLSVTASFAGLAVGLKAMKDVSKAGKPKKSADA